MDVDLYQYKVINLGEFWFTVTAKRGIYTIPEIQFNSSVMCILIMQIQLQFKWKCIESVDIIDSSKIRNKLKEYPGKKYCWTF